MAGQQQPAYGVCPCPRREPRSKGKDFGGSGCDQRVRAILGWDRPGDLKLVNWFDVPTDGAWRGFEPLIVKLRERQMKGDW